MKILITGATGFLGTALTRYLKTEGHELDLLNSRNCNLLDYDNLKEYGEKTYDFIFHLAAWTQAGDFCIYHSGEQWIINQQINTNVIRWWQEFHRETKLIIMGTSCTYAEDSNLKEEEFMCGEPIESLYTYAMTKRMLLQGARAMAKQYNMKYLCLVPSTLYGADYHTDGRQMHFIFDLIRKIIRGNEYNEPVELWGDGYQKRELVLVDDFVKIMWWLAQNYENEIFNIGAGEEYSIRTFADIICKYVGYDSNKILYDTSKYVGAKSKCLDVTKIKDALPEYKLTPLENGLKETIDWFYKSKAY